MAVYVDSLFTMEAREAQAWHVGARNGHRWCHMLADTEVELVRFAIRIGLRPAWLQRKPVLHFDLTPPRRERAVKLGAREVTRRELVGIMRSQRAVKTEA
jgi:hypothetical protein